MHVSFRFFLSVAIIDHLLFGQDGVISTRFPHPEVTFGHLDLVDCAVQCLFSRANSMRASALCKRGKGRTPACVVQDPNMKAGPENCVIWSDGHRNRNSRFFNSL